jgi:membrane fusion protein, multidrug efflux system
MKRLLPYLVFVLLTAGLVVFVYKDRILPPAPGTNAAGAPPGATGGRDQGGSRGGGFRRGDQIVPVLAAKAQTANVPVYLNGVGTVQAFNTATVRAQVSGRLTAVNYTEGQEVKTGDVLAQIDAVLYQAIYDQAVGKKAQDEALLANTKIDQKRYDDLVKTNSVSSQQADTTRSLVHQYEAQIKQDQAMIDNALANLNFATVRAPIDGRTGIRLVDMGNLVSATDATGIVVITQLRPIAIVFTLPENTVSDVLDAQSKGKVPLQAVTGAGVIGEGSLLVVDNQIDQTTGTVKIKGVFPNDTNRLWPGQFVNVRLKLKTLENAIVVPSVAVQQGANGSYVYLVKPDSTVKLTYVKVVQEGERRSVIGEGVAVGDQVVTSGFASLQDGSKVRVDAAPEGGASSGTPATSNAPSGTTDAVSPAISAPAGPGGTGGNQERKRRRDEAAADGPPANGDTNGRRRKRDQGADSGSTIAAPADQGPQKQ